MLLPNRKIKALIFFALFSFLFITLLNTYAHADVPVSPQATNKTNFFDNFDPKSPNAEKILKQLDRDYERITGNKARVLPEALPAGSRECYKMSCHLWADVDLNLQRLFLYIDGVLTYTWKTSSGRFGFETPPMDSHPNGRMYEKHTSPKYPEGDYHGLGNMPFAVFIEGGYAIHGTTKGSWGNLGTPASHGCIRLHPDNAEMFFVMVRRTGIYKTWISVN